MLTMPSGLSEDAARSVTDAASATAMPSEAADSPQAYFQLRQLIMDAGLMDRRYGYYLARGLASLALFLGALGFVFVLPPGWVWTVVAAILLAFTTNQLGVIGHDAGHLAVFRRERPNWALGHLCLSVLLGVSFWSWRDHHNQHHVLTNIQDEDPDLEFGGVFTLSEQKVAAQRGVRRWFTRYQAWFFVPIVMLTLDWGFRVGGWRYALVELRGWRRVNQVLLLLLSIALWASPALVLGWRWLAIYVGAQWVGNLYLGMVFAPNHKGMPTWTSGRKLSFLDRQVLSSCNVKSGPIADYVFSGLNYQIEHHLFPSMPRVNFCRAQPIVREFCRARGLPYEDLSVLGAYRQVFGALNQCGQGR